MSNRMVFVYLRILLVLFTGRESFVLWFLISSVLIYVMEDLLTKTPRKRVANFTTDEKAILAQLIKKRPIVESKVTDGKSIAKKQAAWDAITQEFNSNANVYKRETITLKRAWDNMKALTRKTRATERGNLLRTGGGPHAPPLPPQHEAIISMVEEAAPAMMIEVKNTFDGDRTILDTVDNTQTIPSELIETSDVLDIEKIKNTIFEVQDNKIDENIFEVQDNKIDENIFEITDNNCVQIEDIKNSTVIKTRDQVRRPTDYIRREAVIRINLLENKKKMEMQILKTQLEIEQIKKRSALAEEERNRTLLEKAKIELEELKKSIAKQSQHS